MMITGCSTVLPKTETQILPSTKGIGTAPPIEPLQLEEYGFNIVRSKEEASREFPEGDVWIVMDSEQYKIFARNMEEIIRLTKDMSDIIEFYENQIEAAKTKAE